MCTSCGCGASPDPHDHEAHDHDHDHDHDNGHGHGANHHHHHAAEPSAARTVRVERDLLAKNQRIAREIRRQAADRRIALFNLIGSPGAGKTALLEATIRRLRAHVPLAVLEGDQATDRDAKRIENAGCRVIQINTGAGCHLDASMIDIGLQGIAPARESIVFVENVGNLVCPALFDLGELAKVVVLSVTEGEDKPLKYPHVFRAAQLMVLTKTDLLPHLAFDADRCVEYARQVNPRLQVIRLSAVRGDGVDDFCAWLRANAARVWDGEYEASAS
jgi:hydrogenase nickel incorporation protein HypB